MSYQGKLDAITLPNGDTHSVVNLVCGNVNAINTSGEYLYRIFTDLPSIYLDYGEDIVYALNFSDAISSAGYSELEVFDFGSAEYYTSVLFNNGGTAYYLTGRHSSYKIHDGETVVFKKVTIREYETDYERYLVLGVFPKYAEIDYNSLINKPTLATVATTGDYNDLSNKLSAGTNISISSSNVISATDTKPSNWHGTTETDRTGTDWASVPTTQDIELPNNSTKSVGTFQLTAGVWIVEVAVSFNSNANGRRVMGISNTKDASDFGGTINRVSTRAVDGDYTVLSKTVLLYPSATTRYHVVAFQNRGGGLYVYPRYRAIKIL